MSYFKSLSFLVFVLVLGSAAQAENEQESFNSLALRCAPNIAVDTLRALVKTESGFNPYAIGVVGSKGLQPKNLQEAVFYVSELVAKKRSFSVGLGQINEANFASLGVTAEQLFEPCTNLKATAKILSKCYARMMKKGQGEAQALADALSCYYSGNDKVGYQHGYVSRVAKNSKSYVENISVPSISLLTNPQAASADLSSAADVVSAVPKLLQSSHPESSEKNKLIF